MEDHLTMNEKKILVFIFNLFGDILPNKTRIILISDE